MSYAEPTLFDSLKALRQATTPTDLAADAAPLVDVLKKHGAIGHRWMSAAELVDSLGWPAGDSSERKLRTLIEARAQEILSHPSKGYCAMAYAHPDEALHIENYFLAMRDNFEARALAVRVGYHTHGRSL